MRSVEPQANGPLCLLQGDKSSACWDEMLLQTYTMGQPHLGVETHRYLVLLSSIHVVAR